MVVLVPIFIVGGYIFIIYGTNIPELAENQARYNEQHPVDPCRIVASQDPTGLPCMHPIIPDHTMEDCKPVLDNPNAYFREAVEECQQFLRMSQP